MTRLSAEPRDRVKSMLGVVVIHALVGLALLRGLGVTVHPAARSIPQLIDVALIPPPPPAIPAQPDTQTEEKPRPEDPEGAASPANLKNTPTEVVAPEPVIQLPVPPPIPVAPVAGQGSAPAAGAAPFPGPGTGAGGVGNGLGSGLYGNGTGGGGGGRGAKARYLSGGIDPDDYPRSAIQRRAQGKTFVRFTVLPNGRVRDCRVTRSSGHRDLDAATCPLLERRLRYRPARDATGQPIAAAIDGQQDWELGPDTIREIEPEIITERY